MLFSKKNDANTAHAFVFESLAGNKPLLLSQFEGKVLLVVNTASKCGFTRQYEGLEQLYNLYKDKGLIVIGVPCDDFGHQEPGTNDTISEFCQLNYGVSFPMTKKEHVKGKDAHPFYRWAKKILGCVTTPKWNFHKYLINKKGELVDYFYTPTKPNSKRLIRAIEKRLNEV
jgi:glutathione peroxidase